MGKAAAASSSKCQAQALTTKKRRKTTHGSFKNVLDSPFCVRTPACSEALTDRLLAELRRAASATAAAAAATASGGAAAAAGDRCKGAGAVGDGKRGDVKHVSSAAAAATASGAAEGVQGAPLCSLVRGVNAVTRALEALPAAASAAASSASSSSGIPVMRFVVTATAGDAAAGTLAGHVAVLARARGVPVVALPRPSTALAAAVGGRRCLAIGVRACDDGDDGALLSVLAEAAPAPDDGTAGGDRSSESPCLLGVRLRHYHTRTGTTAAPAAAAAAAVRR